MGDKPRIVVSKCLGFEACRYNGQEIKDEFIEKLGGHVEFVTVCPEVGIGLKVPRKALRIVEENGENILYQPETGKSFTEEVISFSKDFLDSVGDIQGFILKNRSPCCGLNSTRVYPGFDKGIPYYNKNGFFVEEILKKFPNLAMEDEGRLHNFSIRKNFLIRIFAMNEFGRIKDFETLKSFHEKNEFLFSAYSADIFKKLGEITEEKGDDLFVDYKEGLEELFLNAPGYKSWVEIIMKAFGRFSSKLSEEESRFFLENIWEYENEKVPFSVLVKLVSAEAIRFDDQFLLNQTFLHPFPLDLIEISDSGKGREYK
jgi:uncharacterized protein YbbK (DUF523 family)/uncharacterized protein YbgA (DUF1722 family)